MEGRELKRSYTHLDMPVTRRHYPNHHHHQYAMNKTNKKTPKTKPSLELYKPPSQRDVHQTKLNVHAKEFNPLQSSKSSGTLLTEKKSGIINNSPKNHNHQVKFVDDSARASILMKSKSTTSGLHETGDNLIPIAQIQHFRDTTSKFIITKACTDMSLLELIELAPKIIIDHALEDRAHALSYATVAVRIIEMEPKDNFIEAFLNMCRYTVKGKCLKDNTHRYHAFLAFLNELYSLLKYKQVLCKNLSSATPSHLILELVAQVCKSILHQKPLTARQEVECLFFTVTTVGRDLEAEDPKILEGLMVSIRDAFLSSSTSQPIKRTLLQLVELKASKWVLPAHAVCYYTKSFMKLI